jgi:hypothetical protein
MSKTGEVLRLRFNTLKGVAVNSVTYDRDLDPQIRILGLPYDTDSAIFFTGFQDANKK